MYPHEAALRGIDSLMRPKSVAVIGASAKRAASGNQLLSNLARYGFAGDVHVVHPTAELVDGLASVSSIAKLPNGVDVAFVSLPARAVVPALVELADAGCRSAVVPTVGMSSGQLADLRALVRTRDLVVHGPNCMGILNFSDGVPLWPYEGMLTVERPGDVTIVSQSGSATLFVTRSLERASVSKVVSTGSEIGLSAENYLSWLAQDADTRAVGLVLESIKDVPAFVAAVSALRRAGKPLVTLKVGRTEAGAAATTAHTGALVGRDEVYSALFERLDVPLVADYDEMAAALELLSWQAGPTGRQAAGRRVAAITISGGQAALTADLAAARAMPLAEFSSDTVRVIEGLLPGVRDVRNPLDTGDEEYGETAFGDTIIAVANDPGVDSVLVVLDAQATLNDAEVDFERDAFQEVVRAAAAVETPVVVASSSSVSTHPRSRSTLGDVPLLRGIPNALVALRALGSNRRPIAPLPQRPDSLPAAEEVTELRALVDRADSRLGSDLLRRLMSAYRLPFIASTTVQDLRAAEAWAHSRYPVVAKIDSPDVAHRSDIGAVVLDIHDPAALASAMSAIERRVRAAHPQARIAGFELQEQVSAGVEVLLGFVADPVFGATVTVGMGGTLVELLDDAAVGPAPMTAAEAGELIAGTRLGRLLAGYRNLHPATDPSEVVDILVRLSWFAADFADLVAGADFNPAVVEPGTGRVRLVDALVERVATTHTQMPSAGTEFVGKWLTVDEPRLRAFDRAAYVDENVVAMDIDRYPDGLVEGFHLVALIERLHRGVLDVGTAGQLGRCAGIDKIRFVSPVHAGERMRARGTVASIEQVDGGLVVEFDTTVEVEGRSKPGFVVRWRQVWSADHEGPGTALRDRTDGRPDDVLVVTVPFAEFPSAVGRTFRSDWLAVEPDRQEAFAFAGSAVGDSVVDGGASDRLSELHLVTLLDHLVNPVVHPSDETWFGWNYGLDDVRFDGSVRPGERLRLHGSVAAVEPRGAGHLVRLDCTLEIEGRSEPALLCHWLALWLPETDVQRGGHDD